MADRVATELEHHFQRSDFRGDDDLVLPHPRTGNPYDASKMRKRFYEAMRAAALGHLIGRENGITFHSLRHNVNAWVMWPAGVFPLAALTRTPVPAT
jgi:hypothetical protein